MIRRKRLSQLGSTVAVTLLFLFLIPQSGAVEQSVNNWHCAYALDGDYETSASHSVAGDDSSDPNTRTNCLSSTSPPLKVAHYSVADGVTTTAPRAYAAGLAENNIAGSSWNFFACLRLQQTGETTDCSNVFGRVYANSYKYDPIANWISLWTSPSPMPQSVRVFSTDSSLFPSEATCQDFFTNGGENCDETVVNVFTYSGAKTTAASFQDPTSDSGLVASEGFASFTTHDANGDDTLLIGGIQHPMSPGDSVTIGAIRISVSTSVGGGLDWTMETTDGSDQVFVDNDLTVWSFL